MKMVTVYTDGACSGNPGPGGWGAILEYQGHERELSGGAPETTNNRMELTAVIQALRQLKEPCAVELYSDSKYVVDALEKGWVWGWKNAAGSSPIRNRRSMWTYGRSFCRCSNATGSVVTGSRATARTLRTTDVTRWPWQSPRNIKLNRFFFGGVYEVSGNFL